ncbi:MAG: formate dehydrogenase [Kiloniellaceae bacterium]
MSKKTTASIGRRDFFRSVGLGAGVAAVGLSASTVKAAAPSKASAKGAGYRETDHVKKFYELARF